jgi:hypothetical protein
MIPLTCGLLQQDETQRFAPAVLWSRKMPGFAMQRLQPEAPVEVLLSLAID